MLVFERLTVLIGFKAAVIVDYPDSKKKKKIYLALCAGDGDLSNIKPILNDWDEEEVDGGQDNEEEDKVNVLSKK